MKIWISCLACSTELFLTSRTNEISSKRCLDVVKDILLLFKKIMMIINIKEVERKVKQTYFIFYTTSYLEKMKHGSKNRHGCRRRYCLKNILRFLFDPNFSAVIQLVCFLPTTKNYLTSLRCRLKEREEKKLKNNL